MQREHTPQAAINLGSASQKTLGGNGRPFDLVKDIPAPAGIVND